MVATLHRTIVGRTPGFVAVATASDTNTALDEIRRTRPHLMLLDVTLRGADGVSLARILRSRRSQVEIIAVTASRESAVVRSLLHLGVIDYLVKPFAPERLQQALLAFRHRMRCLADQPYIELALSQQDVDAATGAPAMVGTWLPKGINQEVLDHIRAVLWEQRSGLSAAALAVRTGRARVTVRRYLEYLVTTNQADIVPVTGGPGRPTKLYRPLRH